MQGSIKRGLGFIYSKTDLEFILIRMIWLFPQIRGPFLGCPRSKISVIVEIRAPDSWKLPFEQSQLTRAVHLRSCRGPLAMWGWHLVWTQKNRTPDTRTPKNPTPRDKK